MNCFRISLWIVVGLLFSTIGANAAEMKVTKDIPYSSEKLERHVLDVYAPADAKSLPVVFWIHGGGWQAGDKSQIALKPQWFCLLYTSDAADE